MHLFQRTLLQGAHDRLVDAGRMYPLANEKLATEVFDKVASDLGIPPILDSMPNQDEATALGNALIDYSQKLAANGYSPDQETMQLAKVASQRDPGEKALIVAEYYIQKAAEEGSLRPSEGAGLSAAAMNDLIARQDLMNRSLGAYDVRQGQTNFAMPGVVGREMGAPGAPTTGAQVKVAEGEAAAAAYAPQAPNVQMVHQGGPGGYEAHQGWDRAMDALRTGARNFTNNPLDNYRQGGAAAREANRLGQIAKGHPDNPHILLNRQDQFERKALGYRAGLGMQGAAAGASTLGLALGARALYRHFNPEKEVQASQKVALDMPDLGAAWESIKGRVLALKNSVASVPGGVRDAYNNFGANHPNAAAFGSALTRNPLHNVEDALAAHALAGRANALGANPGFPELASRYGGIAGDAATHRNLMGGAAALQGVAGLAGAAGLAYGGKRLYDHFQGSPEDMEVNASDGSAEALAQALHEHGIEPTPELVAALHEAMEAEEGGAPGGEGGGMPPGLDPSKQASEGSLHPTPPGNNLTGAAAHDRVAALDKKNRAPGAFATPQGKTDLSTASGELGAEKKAELAWRENIVKTAQDWGPYLPAAWPERTKHAAIQQIASQPPNARLAYVKQLLQG